MLIGFNDLPTPILTRILLSSTHHQDLLRWVALVSQVCSAWWKVARTSPAFGLGLPRERQVNDVRLGGRKAYWVNGDRVYHHCDIFSDGRAQMLRELSEVLRVAREGFVDSYGDEQGPGELFIFNRTLDTDAGILCACLQALPSPLHLHLIDLIGLDLSAQAAISLSHTIGEKGFSSEGLQFLCIRNNPELGDEGIAALCEVLPPTLGQFFIHDTGCGDVGIAALTAALPRLPNLWRLAVSRNHDVGEDTWCSFFEALPQLQALQYLFAYENSSLGDDAARTLVAALPRCAPTLEKIELAGCDIGAEQKAALREAWGPEREDEFNFSEDEDK